MIDDHEARMRSIRIVTVPAGEAPLWVRECWVGLAIPLAAHEAKVRRGFGILSGPRSMLGMLIASACGRGYELRGYAVHSFVAIDILRAAHPEAAAWWAKHAQRYLRPGRCFVFQEMECELVATPDPSPR